MTTPWKPLSRDECRDLTCMLAGAPWPDHVLAELQRLLSIYDRLRDDGARPVDPATLSRRDGKEVIETGRVPAWRRSPIPSAVTTLVARAGLYWDSYKAGFFVRDDNDSGEACMARFARLVAASGGDITAAASTTPCPAPNPPRSRSMEPRHPRRGDERDCRCYERARAQPLPVP